jgi:ankyrin repeat protein
LPVELQWFAAAKQGDLPLMKRLMHDSLEPFTGDGAAASSPEPQQPAPAPGSSPPALLSARARGIGHTALHWASSSGHVHVAAWLLDAGADPDAPNAGGSTPLHSAVSSGQIDTARLLLARGAKQKPDEFGDTPEVLASRRGMAVMLDLLRAAA